MRKKKPKLVTIKRKLFKIWSEKVREKADHICEYCGASVNNPENTCNKVDSHHIQSRKIKNNPLKWDIRNGICLCPFHHKFSCNESFHNSPVVTINWLKENIPDKFNYILEHYQDEVDLDNLHVLEEIEKCLIEDKNIDINHLKKIEENNPRGRRKKKESLCQMITNE